MGHTTVKDIEQIFKRRAKGYLSMCDESGVKPGVRYIELDGNLFFMAYSLDLFEYIIKQLFALLPSDAACIDFDGQYIRLASSSNQASTGSFLHRYFIIMASKAWETIPQGGKVPVLKFTFECSLKEVKNETKIS